jgi:hypothetical protein
MLKAGKIGGKSFSKIAGIGHSYGSVQLNAITQVSGSTTGWWKYLQHPADSSMLP